MIDNESPYFTIGLSWAYLEVHNYAGAIYFRIVAALPPLGFLQIIVLRSLRPSCAAEHLFTQSRISSHFTID